MIKKILIAVLSVLVAQAASAEGAPYLGAAVGIATNTSDAPNLNYRGMPLTLSAGYGGLLSQNLYLGGEVFGRLGTANLDNNGLKSSYGYGISVLPGLMLGERAMTFLRVGWVRSHFTPEGTTSNRDVDGAQLGVGMQLGLTQNVDLRGEYTFSDYQSFGSIRNPKQDQYNLGLIFKLD